MGEKFKITFNDIVKVANGRDETDAPCSSATLSIDEIEENETKNIQEVFFKEAEINLFYSGGCIVCQADFPITSSFEYHQALNMCKDWMIHMPENMDNNKLLSLTLVPHLLMGEIILFFNELVYYSGHQVDKCFRLILCFNNESTQVFETEDIDYEEIIKNVNLELNEEENQILEEIEEIEKETKDIENENNIYNQFIQKNYGNITIESDEMNQTDSMIRHTSEGGNDYEDKK